MEPGGQGLPGTDTNDSGQVTDANSLTESFLSSVTDESHKAILQQYVPEWDKQVGSKFESIHNEYKPYKDFGSIDEIKAWQQAANIIQTNPEYVLDVIAKELGHQVVRQGQQPQQQQQQTPIPGLPAGGNVPDEFKQQFEKLQKDLGTLANAFLAQKSKADEEAEQKQLDEFLVQLHSKHKDVAFDDTWVLYQIQAGKDPDQAVKEFAAMYQPVQKQTVPAPPPFAGGLPAAGGQKDVTKLNRNETQDLVANILQAAAQQNN